MASLLTSMKGRAVISVNDVPEMRQAFAGLRQRPLSITYTVGSAESRSPSRELPITNFSHHHEQSGSRKESTTAADLAAGWGNCAASGYVLKR